MVREALLYERENDLRVRCALCAHRCLIDAGARGICGVRENREGVLGSLVYGRVIAENVDPIEKKPLFHVLPGSRSFSIATAGCNFRCTFCQNHEISQLPREENRIIGKERTPAKIVERARLTGCSSISYTYTEPTIYFEFAWDTAGIAREQGLKNVFVTNGYMTAETLDLPWSRDPMAHQPFPSPVPNDKNTADVRGLHPSGRGDRQSRRSEIHLLWKPPRRCR